MHKTNRIYLFAATISCNKTSTFKNEFIINLNRHYVFVDIIPRCAEPEQQGAVGMKMTRCFALCAFHETRKDSSLDDCRGNLNSIFYSVKKRMCE